MFDPEAAIKAAAERASVSGLTIAVSWEYHRCLTASERDEIDRWLVRTKHPLAFEPGTQESRFRRLVSEKLGS